MSTPDAAGGSARPRRFVFEATLTFVVIAACGFWRAPIPAVNEPTYLGQARHVADPEFAARDLFYGSSRPHLAFYRAIGPLAASAGFETAAFVGRLCGYALLAVGWTALISVLVDRTGAAPLSATLWLALAAVGNLSGEWVVGGVESKVFAYGCGFLGLAAVCAGRAIAAAAAIGASVSLHAVVGGWFLLGAFAAIRFDRLARAPGATLGRGVIAIVVFSATALPGLIPALAVLAGDGADAAEARFIHVFRRLGHHLDPTKFPLEAWLGYALLFAAWVALPRFAADPVRRGRFDRVVAASLLFAFAGLLVGVHLVPAESMPLRDVRSWLLQFYPFRLVDVLLPAAVAIAAAAWLLREGAEAVLAATLVGLATIALAPAPDRDPSGMSPSIAADWRELREWARDETPPDALFITLPNSWAFKWVAERAEYVSWKDCPQDAASILEWRRRWDVLRAWATEQYGDDLSYDAGDLADLRRRTGADYLVARRRGPMTADPVFRNDTFRVYELPKFIPPRLP